MDRRLSLAVLIALAIVLVGVYLLMKSAPYSPYVVYPVIFKFVFTALFGFVVINIITGGMEAYGDAKGIQKDVDALIDLFKLFAYSVLAVVLLEALNINVTGLLIGAGFLGIIVGLAAQTTLGNVFAGISILSTRPFSVGERITISAWQYVIKEESYPHEGFLQGVTGVVEQIGIVYTKVVMDDGVPAFIPNGLISTSLILNHRRSNERIVNFRVELEKGRDFGKFEKEFRRKVMKIKDIGKLVLEMDVYISYFRADSYGVGIEVTTMEKDEKMLVRLLKEVALDALSKK
ncbi:MAG: mechanosensitive ion channel family protein [Candidatus Marsarchaeota archaeon]|nr:mechanosensitive ion channel family protein [Candidatus Marsarchaeota archaeon]